MKEAAVARTLRAIRKNWSFGVPVIFVGGAFKRGPPTMVSTT